jgi:hypothetical protein
MWPSHLERITARGLPTALRETRSYQEPLKSRSSKWGKKPLREQKLTFIADQVFDIGLPAKHYTQHLSSQLVWGRVFFVHSARGRIRKSIDAIPSKREQLCDDSIIFFRAGEDLISEA